MIYKRIITILWSLLVSFLLIIEGDIKPTKNKNEVVDTESYSHPELNIGNMITEKDVIKDLYYQYLTREIPAMFVDNFYQYTVHDIPHGLELLAIGDKESDWSINIVNIVSYNQNGSHDLGPLQLNSNNLENEHFMKYYAPENRDEFEPNNLYMVICINYYEGLKKELYDLFNVFKVYNGGRRALLPTASSYEITNKYARDTLNYLDSRQKSWGEFLSQNYTSLFMEYCDKYEWTKGLTKKYFTTRTIFPINIKISFLVDSYNWAYFFTRLETLLYNDRTIAKIKRFLNRQIKYVQTVYIYIQSVTGEEEPRFDAAAC